MSATQYPPVRTTETDRPARLAVLDDDLGRFARDLLGRAAEGLRLAHDPATGQMAQTVRAVIGAEGVEVRAEGSNPRYAAMAALGLARLPLSTQRDVLSGATAAGLSARLSARMVQEPADPGAVALAAWAAAEIEGRYDDRLFARMRRQLAGSAVLPTVDVAWMVSAACSALPLAGPGAAGGLVGVIVDGTRMLLRHRGPGGIYPHLLSAEGPALGPDALRAHVGSFADQIYPVQALVRAARHSDPVLLHEAELTAGRLCALQGEHGQWWWHYDARNAGIVERYPVYSVHQHAMAPMVLFELAEAGGTDHTASIVRGLSWLNRHPEVVEELVSERWGLVWRKVGRREPAKLARGLHATATALRPGTRLPGIDRALPPGRVDHECRPYELGWMLYAWLPGSLR